MKRTRTPCPPSSSSYRPIPPAELSLRLSCRSVLSSPRRRQPLPRPTRTTNATQERPLAKGRVDRWYGDETPICSGYIGSIHREGGERAIGRRGPLSDYHCRNVTCAEGDGKMLPRYLGRGGLGLGFRERRQWSLSSLGKMQTLIRHWFYDFAIYVGHTLHVVK